MNSGRRKQSPQTLRRLIRATILAATAGLLAHGSATAQEESRQTRLLAYFPFDGGSVEETARGIESAVVVTGEEEFDGFGIVSDGGDTPRGSTTGAVDPDGRYGDALAFTEQSGRVLAPLDLDFSTHPRITVSLWVKVESAEAAERGFLLSTGHGSDRTPGLRLVNGHVVAAAGGGQLHNYAGDLRVGEWNHVAAIWDAEARTVRIYTNGRGDQRAGVETLDPEVIAADRRSQSELENPLRPAWLPTRHLVLGALGIGGSRELRGVSLDEVRIWSGALTEDEFREIMNAESPPPLGPVAPPPPPPQERETVAAAEEDDRFDPPAEEDGGRDAEDRGRLVDWTLSDDYQLSDISGDAGDRQRRVDFFPGEGVEGVEVFEGSIGWSEQADRPCKLFVRGNPISGFRCERAGGYPQSHTVRLGSGYYLNTLQICRNRRSGRLKGLKVWGHRVEIDRNANEMSYGDPNADTRTLNNCNEWSDVVACERGSIASGAQAHFEDVGTSNREQIVGVRLICREVVGVYE